jgi:hypothetical protein
MPLLEHVLLDCVDVSDVHQNFYNVNNLCDLFTNVAGDTTFKFLKGSCQLENVFRAICYKFAGPNCLASVLKYFIIKGLKSLRNRTIGYMIFQCVLGFLVNNCVPMNTYPSWQDPLYLRSKSQGTGSIDQMSYRS